jgi:uncharacterized protein (TIGR03437 family)
MHAAVPAAIYLAKAIEFGRQEIYAAAIVLVFYVAIESWQFLRGSADGQPRRKAFLSALVGWDSRASTSKTVAVAWTVVIAFMVATVGLIAISKGADFLAATLNKTSDLYLVLLGGPYAAAIFAKVAVKSQVDKGTLQKPDGTPSALDVVTDDTGNTDVYDLQYTLFNLIAMVIVLSLFLPHPDSGMPDVPTFLAMLTGGAALTYTVNKVASGGNAAKLESVFPQSARVKSTVTLYGKNLAVPAADPGTIKDKTQVTLGGVLAPLVDVSPNQVTITVPSSPGGAWSAAPQEIHIKTNGDDDATLPAALTILGVAPVIDDVQPRPLSTADTSVTVRGHWFLATDPSVAQAGEIPEVRFSTPIGSWKGTITDSTDSSRDSTLLVDVPTEIVDAIKNNKVTSLDVFVIRRDNGTAGPFKLDTVPET